VACGLVTVMLAPVWPQESTAVVGGALVLMVLGGVDDVRALPASLRLAIQSLVILFLMLMLPSSLRLLPETMPLLLERLLGGLALLWFVNLVNFMDGIDWITGAELIPIWLVVLVFGLLIDDDAVVLVCAILIGSYLGFMPLNRPVAQLFLGDVGSLPLGFITGWLLYRIGAQFNLVCAVLPPLYYLIDATFTLIHRAIKGEKVWEAHRSHFYQQATNHGLSVSGIVWRIALTNVGLGIVALGAIDEPPKGALIALTAGGGLVGLLVRSLMRERAPTNDPEPLSIP
jgi:UDP-N-acetylmuramyl pentapeptide phosphotransferase/UDP-N-acetylglucosamine-1-phosphate transferase